jgi:hypothetical protein
MRRAIAIKQKRIGPPMTQRDYLNHELRGKAELFETLRPPRAVSK